jgi:hemin uptake protein HemP
MILLTHSLNSVTILRLQPQLKTQPTMNQADSTPQATDGSEQPKPPLTRRLESSDLLQGEREILISHGDELYRLRLTRNGKLILQK